MRKSIPGEMSDSPDVLLVNSKDTGKAVKIGHSCAAVTHHRPPPATGAGKANLRLTSRVKAGARPVQGTESERGNTIIIAHVPQAEMLRYATQLRSITGGRGYFSMELDHYDIVPMQIAGPIMEAHRKEMEAKKEE